MGGEDKAIQRVCHGEPRGTARDENDNEEENKADAELDVKFVV